MTIFFLILAQSEIFGATHCSSVLWICLVVTNKCNLHYCCRLYCVCQIDVLMLYTLVRMVKCNVHSDTLNTERICTCGVVRNCLSLTQ
jgi:hypothetical protein